MDHRANLDWGNLRKVTNKSWRTSLSDFPSPVAVQQSIWLSRVVETSGVVWVTGPRRRWRGCWNWCWWYNWGHSDRDSKFKIWNIIHLFTSTRHCTWIRWSNCDQYLIYWRKQCEISCYQWQCHTHQVMTWMTGQSGSSHCCNQFGKYGPKMVR